jgi:RHH-type proline utilization regulon transcriptional repressor/proline dehydrogenase/delta 1-pyrroline-5-carboxylate dehydrogenase
MTADREREIIELARALASKAGEHKPSLFEAQDWIGRMIDWSLKDEALRVALFRFVDVLPSLESAAEIGRHLEEYFARVDHALGGLVFLAQALHAGWLVAPVVRSNVTRLARRFIAEEEPRALAEVLAKLREEPAAFTLDVVGEATVSEQEADRMQRRYLDLIGRLGALAREWPAIPQIDAGPAGPLPRVNVSVKLSSLAARFDPLDPDTAETVRGRLRPLLREAARLGAALTIDMEQHAYKDLTLEIFKSLLEEEEFRERPPLAIALQAYLRETRRDLEELLGWAARARRRIGVRLVKGAYWDSEIAWARQKNWPVPVFLEKAETDLNYEACSELLLSRYDVADAAFGSHNLRSLAHAIVTARRLGVPERGYEIQMLYGMGEPVRRAIVESGQRVRVYVPVGELLPGIAYLIRRLMENTSNTSFLRQAYAEEREIEALIARPLPRRRREATGSTTRWRSPGRESRPAPGSNLSTPPARRGSWAAWRRPAREKRREPWRPRRGFFRGGAKRRRRSARGSSFAPRTSFAAAASSSRPGRSSRSARVGARRTPTSSRRSTISSITGERSCGSPSLGPPSAFPARAMSICTSRAASPRSSRRGTSRSRSSPA